MGVAGVAWATFLCQCVSCVLAVTVVFRRLSKVEGAEKAPVFSGRILQRILRIAIPSVLQQSFISVGNIILQGVINTFGSGVIAGYSAGVKLNNLVITSFTTLGNGISNYTAQNIGAGKLLRVKEGFRAGLKLVWALSLPMMLLYVFGGGTLIHIFIDAPTETALQTAVTYLRILSPFYFVVSAKLVADGILRGGGVMGKFMISTFTDLILRVVLAVVLSKTALGATGIWCAWPVGWTVATVLSVLFYKQGYWNRMEGNIRINCCGSRSFLYGSSGCRFYAGFPEKNVKIRESYGMIIKTSGKRERSGGMDKQNLLSVVVADDEQELLGAVCQLIDWAGIGFKLVGRASNGLDALQLVEELQPDFLLTDIHMPFISGRRWPRRSRPCSRSFRWRF